MQQLSAWQPVITAGTVLPSLFFLGIAATITGVGLLYTAFEVRRFELDYTNCAPLYDTHTCAQLIETNIDIDCKCWYQFELAEEFESSVYLYYSLSNYFQNHRRYEKSVDTVQLNGKLQASSDCQPFQYKGVNGKQVPIVPCGVIANSLFNDTFRLWYHDIISDIAFRVPLLFTGISWPSDHYKFHNPSGASLQRIYANFTNPPYWGNRNIWQLDALDPGNNGLENEGLMVWLRTAAFPQFQKLYARVDHQIGSLFARSLPKGNYFIEIDYNYPVSEFGGGKQFVLSNTSWFGGNNPFLGIAYIVFGGLTILLTLVLLLIHMRYGMHSFKRIMITEKTTYFSKREKRRRAAKYQID